MASEIILSSAVRSNLLSLQKTASLLGKTQERLATGLKVNSALDDPTAFFTASALNSRASDLNRLQDFVGNAVQTLKAADEGITAITNLVESAEAVARQALQTTATISKNAAVITGSNAIAQDVVAVGTGTQTISADLANAANVTGGVGSITGSTAGTLATLNGDATGIDGTAAINSVGFAATDTIAVTVNGTTSTITVVANGASGNTQVNATDSIDVLYQKINAVAGADVTADIPATGTNDQATISFTANVDDFSIQVTDTGGGGGAANQTLADAIGLTNADVGSTNGLTSTTKAKLSNNGFAAGDTIGITVNGTTSTISVVASGASGNNQVNVGDTLEDVYTKINAVAGADVTATFGVGGPTFSFTSNVEDFSLQVTDTSGGGGAANQTLSDGLGLTNADSGSTNGQTTAYKNTDLGDLVGSLSFTINGSQDTITFGTGTGEVNTRAELQTALASLSASSNTGATFEISGNQLVATASDITDGAITVGITDTGSTGIAAELGFTDGQRVGVNSTIDSLIASGSRTLVISDGTNTDTLTFGTGSGEIDTRAELETAIASALSNTNATLTIDGQNRLVVTGDTGETITISGSNSDAAPTTFGLTTTATAATEQNVTNSTRAQFATQYNDLLDQVDDLTRDAGYNGVNLLQSDSLTVTFNEDGSSTLSITGVDFDSGGLGINDSIGAFGSDIDINTALGELDDAKASLRAQASKFGSNLSVVETRQDFTKKLINVLETGAANLTLADTNEEGANLLALQTRQQLSSTALSLASQADQNVLRLF